LKRNFLLPILAVVSAALITLTVTCQAAPIREKVRTEQAETTYKYEISAGYGYTSLNQVNQSRYGLQGVNVSLTRDFGKYFGVTAEGAFYKYPLGSGNPGTPVVDDVLLGPVLHANIYGRVDGFVHVLLGSEHTGGENQNPNLSFAGGAGGGLEYRLSKHLFLLASGDDIESAFTVINPAPGDSPHKSRNSRATFGVAYKF
jgi:hypothetical protein